MEYPAALACFISGECRLRNGERRTGAINGSPENRGRVTAEVNVQEYRRATGEIGQPAAIFCIVLADCDAHQARRTLLRAIHGASRRDGLVSDKRHFLERRGARAIVHPSAPQRSTVLAK